MADLRLEAFDGEDRVADRLEALNLAVHRHAVADLLEVPADALHLVRALDPEEVVRRADVLPPTIPRGARDHQLDFLEYSAVLFDSVTDVGRRPCLRACRHTILRTVLSRCMDWSPR